MSTPTPNTSSDITALRQMLAAEVNALRNFEQTARDDLARELAEIDEAAAPLTAAETKFLSGVEKWEGLLVYYTDVQRADMVTRLEAIGRVIVDRSHAAYMTVLIAPLKG